MGEVAAARLFTPFQRPLFLHGGGLGAHGKEERKSRLKRQENCSQNHAKALLTSWQPNNQKPSTYSSRFNTDLPLSESPRASFDQYLEHKPRVIKAIFAGGEKIQQVNEDEWRIQMPPLQILFLTVWPIIDMRLTCKSNGKEYPPEVPCEITKVLELETTRWKLPGLDNALESSGFNVSVKGALYPDRRGTQSTIKNQFEMNLSYILPPTLLVHENVSRAIVVSVIQRLVDDMKQKANSGVLADYSKFKREKLKNLV
ncbi:hypothetical protein SO802_001051 [Lithocarpus litseifolius]|uniref:Uncharacterized protein n=1 Tax=Lithocarpus litseifolius TaxID=425828 RepID=A0AAW2DVY7_9ROSI